MRKLLLVLSALCLLVPAAAVAQESTDGRPTHTILGIDTHAYTTFGFTRVSEVARWSPGFEVGVEMLFSDNWYGKFEVTMYDVLTEDEVYDEIGDQAVTVAFGKWW